MRTCAERHEVVLVESAGGLDVPLSDEMLSVDLAAEEGWPLVLVTCGRLGAINHALLSLDAAKSRGMEVVGVVHNEFLSDDPRLDADAEESVLRHLSRLGFPAKVVRIPRFSVGGPYPDIDFSELFGT